MLNFFQKEVSIMKSICKIFIIMLLSGMVLFARAKNSNPRLVVEPKIKTQYYWIKDHSNKNEANQLERKRVHKRRRKIRKPVKGLR